MSGVPGHVHLKNVIEPMGPARVLEGFQDCHLVFGMAVILQHYLGARAQLVTRGVITGGMGAAQPLGCTAEQIFYGQARFRAVIENGRVG
jgi:hypothetical protein